MLGLSEGVMKLALDARHFVSNIIMSPTEWEGGHIAFGADPVGVGVAFCLHSCLLNQYVDFDQTCTDTSLGGGKEVIRFW